MADLGNTSTANSSAAAGGPGHRRSSWVVVVLISISAIILGFAFVLHDRSGALPLAITGGVIGLLGIVIGIATNIMDDVH